MKTTKSGRNFISCKFYISFNTLIPIHKDLENLIHQSVKQLLDMNNEFSFSSVEFIHNGTKHTLDHDENGSFYLGENNEKHYVQTQEKEYQEINNVTICVESLDTKFDLPSLVNVIKGNVSRKINAKFPELKKLMFWKRHYLVTTQYSDLEEYISKT